LIELSVELKIQQNRDLEKSANPAYKFTDGELVNIFMGNLLIKSYLRFTLSSL